MAASESVGKRFRLLVMRTWLFWTWGVKTAKIVLLRLRLRNARCKLDRRMSELGAEFYALHRMGEMEFLKSLVVLHKLKMAEEGEARVLAIRDRIDAVESAYLGRREAILASSAHDGQEVR